MKVMVIMVGRWQNVRFTSSFPHIRYVNIKCGSVVVVVIEVVVVVAWEKIGGGRGAVVIGKELTGRGKGKDEIGWVEMIGGGMGT